MTTNKKKPNENNDEISVCEVKCQTYGDDTDSVATLIKSCETESSCSSSITDSTNNVKNSELDENHPTLVKQDMRRFSSFKYEQSFPWLYYSCIKLGYLCKYCELFQTDPTNSSILYLMNIIPASVERSFSYMNLIKTPLRSRLTQRNLEALMRISMEGRDKLSDSDHDTLVDKF